MKTGSQGISLSSLVTKIGFDGDEGKDLNYCDISIYLDNPRFDIGVRTLVERPVLKRQETPAFPRTRKLTIYIYKN